MEDAVVVEAAVEKPQPIHTAQWLGYPGPGGYEPGLLLDFNVVRVREVSSES